MINKRPDCFYKYVPADIAKVILRERTLRWSSPLLFDDPYDVVREMAKGLEMVQIQGCIIDRIIDLMLSDEDLPLGLASRLHFLVNTFRNTDQNRVREEAIEVLRESRGGSLSDGAALKALRIMWQKMVPTFRILCLSARKDIERMWLKYADGQKGVVLEFACVEEVSAPWILAKAVLYEDRATLLDKVAWGKVLVLNQEEASKCLLNESCYIKTTDWAYQEEWRVVSFRRKRELGHYSDYGFHPRSLSALCFGAGISDVNREEIASLLKGDLGHVRLFECPL